jgi:heterodisulfide reductase subunit B
LAKYNIALQPGCHLLWHESNVSKDMHNALNNLAYRTGGTVINYTRTPQCCGSGLAFIHGKASTQMLTAIVNKMIACHANIIVTPCPFCFIQFDQKQTGKNKLPVLYITELCALALGISIDAIGLKYHKIKIE